MTTLCSIAPMQAEFLAAMSCCIRGWSLFCATLVLIDNLCKLMDEWQGTMAEQSVLRQEPCECKEEAVP
jgi:hypothetical protein